MGFVEAIDNLIERLEGVLPEAQWIIEYNAYQILEIKKDEILLGRDSDGEPFPGYLSDPYFNDPNRSIKMTAVQYAAYKHHLIATNRVPRIEHPLNYPNKDDDTPNLRLTTKSWAPGENFQDSMFIRPTEDGIEIGSTYKDAPAISTKYNNKVYPLGPGAKELSWNDLLHPDLEMFLHKE